MQNKQVKKNRQIDFFIFRYLQLISLIQIGPRILPTFNVPLENVNLLTVSIKLKNIYINKKYIVSKKILQFSHPFLGNATVCRQITSPITLRDVEWATQTCLLSFNTIGIWPETMDGTDLSTVAKSNNGKLCATGDDCGKIKLYTHPVTQPKVKLHT